MYDFDILRNKGVTEKTIMEFKESSKRTFININKNDKAKIINMIEDIEYMHIKGVLKTGEKPSSKKKGDMLENLVITLLESNGEIFRIKDKTRTGTNELDVLIELNSQGRRLRAEGIVPREIPDEILFECKNCKSKIGVTYIAKFKTVLDTTTPDWGILISYAGITGNPNNWSDGAGLIKKIACKNQDNRKNIIISISLSRLKEFLIDNNNFLEYMSDRIKALINDVKI